MLFCNLSRKTTIGRGDTGYETNKYFLFLSLRAVFQDCSIILLTTSKQFQNIFKHGTFSMDSQQFRSESRTLMIHIYKTTDTMTLEHKLAKWEACLSYAGQLPICWAWAWVSGRWWVALWAGAGRESGFLSPLSAPRLAPACPHPPSLLGRPRSCRR